MENGAQLGGCTSEHIQSTGLDRGEGYEELRRTDSEVTRSGDGGRETGTAICLFKQPNPPSSLSYF